MDDSQAKLMRASSQGARFMLLATVLQRGMTFVLNTLLYRFVSAEVVGFAANDMELLLSTILFLSRDACRMVATRIPLQQGDGATRATRFQQLVNLAWLPVPASFAIAAAALAFLHSGSSGTAAVSHSVWLYCGAAMIESLAEPLIVLSAAHMFLRVRPSAEMGMVLGRTLVTFAAAYWSNGALGGLCFALGQLAGALAYAAVAVVTFRRAAAARAAEGGASAALPPLSALLPRLSGRASPAALLGCEVAAALGTFTAQNAVKHVLTEGDRILLAATSSPAQRGTYGLVQNYGSLIPRLLFQPLEESLRAFAAKSWWRAGEAEKQSSAPSAAPTPAPVPARTRSRSRSAPRRKAPAKKGSSTSTEPADDLSVSRVAAVSVFLGTLRLVGTVGLLSAALASPLADVACQVLLGQRWATGTEAPTALSASLIYVLFMAFNGATEAFAAAVGSHARLRASTALMVGCFAAYAGAAVAGLRYAGVAGVLAANCVNMGLRALAACSAIAATVREGGAVTVTAALRWRAALPHPATLALAAAASAALWGLRLGYLLPPSVLVAAVNAVLPRAVAAVLPSALLALLPRLAASALVAAPVAGSLLLLDVPTLKATYRAVRSGSGVAAKAVKTE